MDLIERQKAIDALADMHCKSDENGYVWIIRSDAWARIDALPSVTPEQKTGKWISPTSEMIRSRICGSCEVLCSTCKTPAIDKYDFCPNCGARMTEEDV